MTTTTLDLESLRALHIPCKLHVTHCNFCGTAQKWPCTVLLLIQLIDQVRPVLEHAEHALITYQRFLADDQPFVDIIDQMIEQIDDEGVLKEIGHCLERIGRTTVSEVT